MMVAVNASTLFSRNKHPEDQAVADLSYQSDTGLLQQFWRFREYGRNELRPLLLGVAMRLGELGSDLLAPWPLALVIDRVRGTPLHGVWGELSELLGPSQLGMLVVAALAVLLITSLSGAFDYLGDRVMNSAGERITSKIRTDVFAHMQRLPMGYHDRQSVGELTSRIATDTGRIEDGMVGLFATLIPGVLSLVGYTTVLLLVDWRLGLITVCATPLLFFTAARYAKLTRRSARRRRAAEGRLSGFVAESLQGIRTVQAFGRQDLHDKRFRDGNDQVLSAGLRSVDLRARFTPILEVIAAIGTATLLFIGGYGVINGWWSIGILVVVTGYLRDMLKPMRNLSGLALTFTQGAASAERIAAIFDEHTPRTEGDGNLPEVVDGNIELVDVGLDYGRGPVLQGLNLHIRPRERIALLGHNGAGKSTLLSLISGLYPPTSGDVLLDRVPLHSAPDWWRRRQVAVVLQDTFLFSGTIADNIRYGRPEASNEEVEAAAKAALVTEFTDKLDTGINTELADGGIGLSGGQRQRVGIARALLTDAPIVLLDEPTTGLDVNAEELVVQALNTLVVNRTVVMTTHRPALTRLATRIVHLARGTITDNPDAAALAAEPDVEMAAPATNGARVNGGAQVNGAVNGARVNGARVNGAPMNGMPVNGTSVNGTANGMPNGRPPRYNNGSPPQHGSGPRYLAAQGPRGNGGAMRPPPPGYRSVGPPHRTPESIGPRRPAGMDPNRPGSDPGRPPYEQVRRPDERNGLPVDPNRRPGEPAQRPPAPPVRRPQSLEILPVRQLGPAPNTSLDPADKRRIGRFAAYPGTGDPDGRSALEPWWDSRNNESTEQSGSQNGTAQDTGSAGSATPDRQSDGRHREIGNESCA
jgi:ATP-binding cassette subfamily B protein